MLDLTILMKYPFYPKEQKNKNKIYNHTVCISLSLSQTQPCILTYLSESRHVGLVAFSIEASRSFMLQ